MAKLPIIWVHLNDLTNRSAMEGKKTLLKIWWRLVMTWPETCLNMNSFCSRLSSCYKLNCQSLTSKSRTLGSISDTLRVRQALRSSLLADWTKKSCSHLQTQQQCFPRWCLANKCLHACPLCQLSQKWAHKTKNHTKMPNSAPICKNRSPPLIQRGTEAHFRRNL